MNFSLSLPLFLGAMFFLYFASIVSFGMACDWRIRHGISLLSRSVCDSCGHVLGARSLVPVFSWLALRGRCTRCFAPIPKDMVRNEGFWGWIGFVFGFLSAEGFALSPLYPFAAMLLTGGLGVVLYGTRLCADGYFDGWKLLVLPGFASLVLGLAFLGDFLMRI